MAIFLYFMAVICIIGWIIGFFFLAAGAGIHLLILFAVVATLLNIFKCKDVSPI